MPQENDTTVPPLTSSETVEVREVLASRRWWRALWAGLATLAARLKTISSLLPWLIGLLLLVGPERVQGLFGW